jgi:hypothetical protein
MLQNMPSVPGERADFRHSSQERICTTTSKQKPSKHACVWPHTSAHTSLNLLFQAAFLTEVWRWA